MSQGNSFEWGSSDPKRDNQQVIAGRSCGQVSDELQRVDCSLQEEGLGDTVWGWRQ